MAEPTPGQVITPGETPDPQQNSSQPSTEVSVNLSQHTQPQQPLPPAPTPVAPPVQQPSVSVPAIQTQDTPVAPPTPEQQLAPATQPPSETANSPAPLTPNGQNPDSPAGSFAFQPEDEPIEGFQETAQFTTDSPETISWTASEYIAHQKSTSWYLALAGATVLFAVLVYFITGGDILSVTVVVLAAIVLGIYAAKKPKEQQYAISAAGVMVGEKTYSFSLLKTFSIADEGAFSSITFWPMKRFMPALSIYYDPQDEEKIVEVLSNYLPMDTQKTDTVDKFMRKIRF